MLKIFLSISSLLFLTSCLGGEDSTAESISTGGTAAYVAPTTDTSTVSGPQHGEESTNSLGMSFIYLQPDSTTFGPDEGSKKTADVAKGIYLGKHEVSQAQWKAVMGSESPSVYTENKENPVENVSWHDVQTFVKQLSEKEGVEYRLPTEVEWEYACRAGSKTVTPWGSNIEKVEGHANVRDLSYVSSSSDGSGFDFDDGFPSTSPVTALDGNPWGLFHMIGNVSEWTQTGYTEKPDAEADKLEISDDEVDVVIKGGSWNTDRAAMGCGYRESVSSKSLIANSENQPGALGFRVIRECGEVDNRDLIHAFMAAGVAAEIKSNGCRGFSIILATDVLFGFDKHTYKNDDDANNIAIIAALIKEKLNPESLSISGHTDSIGPDAYNQSLSEKRAETVKVTFLESGFTIDSIEAVGHGSAKPRIAADYLEAGQSLADVKCERTDDKSSSRSDGKTDNPCARASNRRVEININ